MPSEVGNVYGKLEVVGPSELRGGETFWPCRCACGKKTLKRGVDLRNCHVRACSKGCLNTDKYPETAITQIEQQCKASAKVRELEYELAREDVERLSKLNCAYCGSPPSNVIKTSRTKKEKLKYSGIDRIDPSKGYLPDNVNPCCITCNVAKSDMSLSDFHSWISKVYQNNIGESTII